MALQAMIWMITIGFLTLGQVLFARGVSMRFKTKDCASSDVLCQPDGAPISVLERGNVCLNTVLYNGDVVFYVTIKNHLTVVDRAAVKRTIPRLGRL